MAWKTPEEKRAIIDAVGVYRAQGMKLGEACAKAGVALPTMHRWEEELHYYADYTAAPAIVEPANTKLTKDSIKNRISGTPVKVQPEKPTTGGGGYGRFTQP